MHYNDQTQIPNFYIGPGIRANVFFRLYAVNEVENLWWTTGQVNSAIRIGDYATGNIAVM